VVIDLPRLNANVLNWQARKTGSRIFYMGIADSARVVPDPTEFDLVLLKTGEPGESRTTDLAAAFSRSVRVDPERFQPAGAFPIADGSLAELYVVMGSVRSAKDPEIAAVVEGSDPALRDLVFGERFRLLGLSSRPAGDGLELRIAWEAMKSAALDRMIAVHLLGDDPEKILAQADYPQDSKGRTVAAGFRWIDVVNLPAAKLPGATKVALQLYVPGGSAPALPADRGPRDWGNTRVHFPLRR
jgi:hypothetical protein